MKWNLAWTGHSPHMNLGSHTDLLQKRYHFSLTLAHRQQSSDCGEVSSPSCFHLNTMQRQKPTRLKREQQLVWCGVGAGKYSLSGAQPSDLLEVKHTDGPGPAAWCRENEQGGARMESIQESWNGGASIERGGQRSAARWRVNSWGAAWGDIKDTWTPPLQNHLTAG